MSTKSWKNLPTKKHFEETKGAWYNLTTTMLVSDVADRDSFRDEQFGFAISPGYHFLKCRADAHSSVSVFWLQKKNYVLF